MWDAVVVAIRDVHNKQQIEKELELLSGLGLVESKEFLVVEDATEGVGSAGSALNALLITVEGLCAARGYTVLNEAVLMEAKILILLMDESRTRLAPGFTPITTPETWGHVPDTILTRALQNIQKLAAHTSLGVWISGTDSTFSLNSDGGNALSDREITAFGFRGNTQLATTHGVYSHDNQNLVTSISFHSEAEKEDPSIVLALLYLPPRIAVQFLSLHSSFPLSATTYHGVDSGSHGLKLSLFFDIILATALDEAAYMKDVGGDDRIEKEERVRRLARSQIWHKMRSTRTRLCILDLENYSYLAGDYFAINDPRTSEQLRHDWVDSMLESISNAAANHPNSISKHLRSIATIDRVFATENKGSLKIFDVLMSLAERDDNSKCCRCLYLLAELLSILSMGKGGLRGGPASNPMFREAFRLIAKDSTRVEGIEEVFLVIRKNWMGSPLNMMRAARHAEAAAQLITKLQVEKMVEKFIPTQSPDSSPVSVSVRAAGRVDIFGGWLDTPPITFMTQPSAVVNMAILVDAQHPLCCTVERESSSGLAICGGGQSITMCSTEEVWRAHSNPTSQGALVCACLVALRLVKSAEQDLKEVLQENFECSGLRITCNSSLPHGSGLGTSSILASCIVKALLRAAGHSSITNEVVAHIVLYVEQLLTTGGGWQDQVGGLYPGIKIGSMDRADNEFSINVEEIQISEELIKSINNRLLLIYTGTTRLAKNLLQEVVRSWYTGGEVVNSIATLQNNVENCRETLRKGEFPTQLVQTYYEVKKELAAGCEPTAIHQLIDDLKMASLIECAWLAGAGGGGFLYVWLAENSTTQHIDDFIRARNSNMTVHSITVSDHPIAEEIHDTQIA